MTSMDEPGDRPSDAERLLALLAPVHQRARMTARRLCRSQAEGDDLFQEAAIRAITQLPKLRDDKAFSTWFYRILFSLHRTRTKRHFWRRLLPLDVVTGAGYEPAGDDSGQWEDRRQGARRMREALNILSAVQREAVVLFDIDGYSLKEVADIQAVSLSAVKSRLTRGRARLRRHYERRGYSESADAVVWNANSSMAEKRNPS